MDPREWQVGIVGTFDVQNYGDLLFPLLAEHELALRLGRVRMHRFSYLSRKAGEWPYEVTSISDLPRLAPSLDALLVGGGFLIRFDKLVAPGYLPPSEEIHHPTGYWLTPALVALQHGVPVIWNAPGMHRNGLPAWAAPLLRLVLSESACIAVRDEPSREALAPFAGREPVAALPDTAFGLGRLLSAERSFGAELERLRASRGLEQPYLIVQAASGMVPFLRFLRQHERRMRDFAVLALPVSPVLCEDAAIVEAEFPDCVRLADWPHPLLTAELIRHAEAVVGHSYHLTITALSAGVPVFNPSRLNGKYSVFAGFDQLHRLPGERQADGLDVDAFLSRFGRRAEPPQLAAALSRLAEHWDRAASIIRRGKTGSPEAIGRFLQELPSLLEGRRPDRPDRPDRAARERGGDPSGPAHSRFAALPRFLAAPLRALGRRLRRTPTR